MAQFLVNNRIEKINFECQNDYITRTLQNVKNLLCLEMGEVPFDRGRGVDPRIFELPMDEMKAALLPELDRVMLWEPDAEIVSATAERGPDGEITITCSVQVAGV